MCGGTNEEVQFLLLKSNGARACDMAAAIATSLGRYVAVYTRYNWTMYGQRKGGAYLSARQQVVAEEYAQGTSHFEVIVARENPVELLCYVLQDVILILQQANRSTKVLRAAVGPEHGMFPRDTPSRKL